MVLLDAALVPVLCLTGAILIERRKLAGDDEPPARTAAERHAGKPKRTMGQTLFGSGAGESV